MREKEGDQEECHLGSLAELDWSCWVELMEKLGWMWLGVELDIGWIGHLVHCLGLMEGHHRLQGCLDHSWQILAQIGLHFLQVDEKIRLASLVGDIVLGWNWGTFGGLSSDLVALMGMVYWDGLLF